MKYGIKFKMKRMSTNAFPPVTQNKSIKLCRKNTFFKNMFHKSMFYSDFQKHSSKTIVHCEFVWMRFNVVADPASFCANKKIYKHSRKLIQLMISKSIFHASI